MKQERNLDDERRDGRRSARMVALAIATGILAVIVSPGVAHATQMADPGPVVGNSVPFATSGNLSAMVRGASTPAKGSLLYPGQCSSVEGASFIAIAANGTESDLGAYTPGGPNASTVEEGAPRGVYGEQLGGPNCLLAIVADISPSSPAAGKIIAERGGVQLLAVPYNVVRTASFSVYLLLIVLAVALAAGTIVASWVFGLQGDNVSNDYKFTDGWATAAAAVGTAGGAVLSASGVLTTFLPQFQTGGALATNVVIGVLLALAPAVFLASRSIVDDSDGSSLPQGASATNKGLIRASTISLIAIYGQVLLAALIVRAMGVHWAIPLVGILAISAILVWYTRSAFNAARDTVSSESTKGLL